MDLTPAQRVTLKAYILSQPDLVAVMLSIDQLVILLNVNASPNFWVWRPSVSRADVYSRQNDLPITPTNNGFWDWTTYKNQGVAEQNAWVQMFMGDVTDFSFLNVREGISKIFTGSAAANAQAAHVLSIGRRLARRVERVFQTGAGTTAVPDTIVAEGPIEQADVISALAS